MDIDLKNLTSILLFLLPGYFFLQGRERFIAGRDLSTLQETAQFFLSSVTIHVALLFLLTTTGILDVADYLSELGSASLPAILRNHIWIITAYAGYSMLFAHYAGRIYGFGFLWLVEHDLDTTRTVVRPTLRNENILLSVMRQRHLQRNRRRKYVFVRVHLKDGTMYEGFVMKYSFAKDGGFTLYLYVPTRTTEAKSVDTYWEDPPFDGVVIRSDAISAMDVSYRDALAFQRRLLRK